MHLTKIKIKDFRSFSGEHEFRVANGVNYFVGPNNCGKSNLVRALELALDPDTEFVPDRDRPMRDGSNPFGRRTTTRITLSFAVGTSKTERTLLAYANRYERALGAKSTYADEGEVQFVTTFSSTVRQVSFQGRSTGARSLPVDSPEHKELLRKFLSLVRFAVIHSGEDLESLLQGKFREILNLVIADHLSSELSTARKAREDYVASLQSSLLEPLRARIEGMVGGMFPEITAALLVPQVPSVEETLSAVDILLGDAVATKLAQKGTGVRGAVLLAMLRYLADESHRSLVLAVEEPEAFLHPGAQEDIRQQLETLATRADVTAITTTHSPYVISRSSDAHITSLRKGKDGFTIKGADTSGSEDRAELLGALYRDAAVSTLLESSLRIPGHATAVVITEGYTDGHFLTLVLQAIGRDDLLQGLHFIPSGGASKVVAQALMAQGATSLPVIALLDHDEQGRAARDRLKSFDWKPQTQLLTLASWPEACNRDHDVEIEDLLPDQAVEKVIARVGHDESVDATSRCGKDGKKHRSLSQSWKDAAPKLLPEALNATDAGGMVWLAEELHRRARALSDAKLRREAHTRSG